MVKISIACLIYKSTRWLDFVYDQVRKHTNLVENEFYFVANDASEKVLRHLKEKNIPHYIHTNTDEQRQEWYINNVYRAWNYAGKMARGEYIVFINSDMAFSPGWLDVLYDRISNPIYPTYHSAVCARLVERGVLRSGTYGIERHFGNVPEDYREEEFLEFIETIKRTECHESGLYMPMLIRKEHMENVGYYPEGNIRPGSDIFNPVYARLGEPCISGDRVLVEKLNTLNVKHYTVFDSIVYHFQEGEMRDTLG